MWADFSGKAFTREQYATHVASLTWQDWKPIGITLHNTAAPTLAQWAESGPAHDARIRNLQSYYEGMGWHGGPHLFISRDWINEFSNPLRRGTHSRCYNATHLGIEMVGDYNSEQFNSGDGAKVRDNAVFAMAVFCRKFGFNPDKDIVFHKDCKLDNHDCPGKLVTKVDIFARVKDEMARQGGQPVPQSGPVPIPPLPRPDIRRRMAKAIIDFEARRDAKGRLMVYQLPAGDGGGTYEVAGINDGFHPKEAAALAAMIRTGRYDEAELYVQDFLVRFTDVVASWSNDYGVEFYLRDCCFNRGPGGAARILQRAVRVPDDGKFGPNTHAAMAGKSAEQLLVALRAAREQYERQVVHRDESSKFWKGLVNRWNNALAQARKFSAESPAVPVPKPEPTKTQTATKITVGGGVALAIGAFVHWLGAHWLLTGGIVVAVLLLVLFFVMHKQGEHEGP